jgi:opacity protein-like surface antigen
VTGTTDTAVGEVGVTMEMRADMDGRTDFDVYMNEAWGWWAMTPELTFGGGYAATLSDIGYGYDGACSCYFIDNADMNFNLSDTTQMRLSYASGPFSMAVALEDASQTFTPPGAQLDDDRLGVAGEMKYTGDTFSGEIAGGWWDVEEDEFFDVDTQWQVGAGVGFALGEMFNISIAAAMGEGPTTSNSEQGAVTDVALPINNKYWGVNALANIGLTDGIHAEIAGGYKVREGDDFDVCSGDLINGGDCDNWAMDGFEYETWAVMGGLYYTPVDQLTIGLEGEWYTSSVDWDGKETAWSCDGGDLDDCGGNPGSNGDTVKLGIDRDTFVAAFVGVWRF